MRCALYARYSHDKQSDRSADDQLAACRAHAKRLGWSVVAELKDEAISGALMVNRPGINALMALAAARAFDVLLTEDEDRVARSLQHAALVLDDLTELGIQWATLYTDRVELMHVAFKGAAAQTELIKISQKTKRGVRANAEKGLATGGRLYGYRTQPGGAVAIVPEEAAIVREIYSRYAAGESAQGLAADLNRRRVPGARGGAWTTAQLSGSRQRANGMLQTELYAGVKVWNRMDVRKDRATGRRIPVMKPRSEWRRTPVPDLAIVDRETFDAVLARKGLLNANQPHTLERRRTGVFAGLIKCACGASYTVIGPNRLACAAHREKGAAVCGNTRTVSRRQVEQRLLHGLKTNMLAPAAIQLYVEAYHRRWQERRRAGLRAEGNVRGQLGEVRRRIARLIEAIETGAATDDTKDRLLQLTDDRQALEQQLLALDDPEPPIELHPHAAAEYARQAGDLQARLNDLGDSQADQRLVASIRGLVESVVVAPRGDFAGAPYDLQIFGRLGPLTGQEQTTATCMGGVVAGGSYTLPHKAGPGTFQLVA